MIFKIFLSISQAIFLREVNAATYDSLENFRVDRGSGLSAFIQKSFKNQVKNDQKIPSDFHGFLIDFSFKKPPKVIPNTIPKSIKKSIGKSTPFFIDFLSILSSKMVPETLPKTLQKRSKKNIEKRVDS